MLASNCWPSIRRARAETHTRLFQERCNAGITRRDNTNPMHQPPETSAGSFRTYGSGPKVYEIPILSCRLTSRFYMAIRTSYRCGSQPAIFVRLCHVVQSKARQPAWSDNGCITASRAVCAPVTRGIADREPGTRRAGSADSDRPRLDRTRADGNVGKRGAAGVRSDQERRGSDRLPRTPSRRSVVPSGAGRDRAACCAGGESIGSIVNDATRATRIRPAATRRSIRARVRAGPARGHIFRAYEEAARAISNSYGVIGTLAAITRDTRGCQNVGNRLRYRCAQAGSDQPYSGRAHRHDQALRRAGHGRRLMALMVGAVVGAKLAIFVPRVLH